MLHIATGVELSIRVDDGINVDEGLSATVQVSYICNMYAKQKQPGCKKSARPIRSHKCKRPKTLISSTAKKLNILLRILLLE